ncbi:MAG: hypothetical protein HYW37_02325 [Candidatus Colwellbacteria bacterium]|nr:hypothetical protein [Candidatus Colwellbacteria bacterium]
MAQEVNSNLGEQFFREEIRVGWPWRLMITMFVVFLIALLVYLGLVFGYKPFLNSSLAGVQSELDSVSAGFSSEKRENFVNFYSQLTNLQKLLVNHKVASKVFSFLELKTAKDVSYTGIDLSVPDRTLTLEGVTRSFESLAAQLTLYDEAKEVRRVTLDSSKSNGTSAQFKVKLLLAPEVFKP